jgi:uncharacterized protein YigE (DUF2233 family)
MTRPAPSLPRAAVALCAVALACGHGNLGAQAVGVAPPLTLVRVDTGKAQLRLFLRDAQGRPYAQFDRLAADVAARGQRLVLAMNAGMYERDLSPVGLFVADGREVHPLNTRHGEGNFYLRPNGVFALTARGPRILSTEAFANAPPSGLLLATQSGPLLLSAGLLAPAVATPPGPASPRAPSRYTRNGVCVDGATVTFAIADQPMTLREFALRLRDEAGCREALYLDGAISKMWDARTGRADRGADVGPILAVVEEAAR